ncbi:hypothetical protein ACIQTW_13145 [Paenarthrobacter sp. NPDC090517]|uniref:hypothetical protein n=1 Tax=Paenarthrobacter sp. NPDC090517 TaxID=3364381 RepID=UPI0037FC5C2A
MDVFTCGEALWISCGTWLGFWNGMIGALTSAVLAALVAIMVVKVTNKHQQAIAARALKAQESATETQLTEQRSEASRERTNTAIGLMVAAVHHGLHTYRQSINRETVLVDMEAALARWMMETQDQDLKLALSPWPSLLFCLFSEANIAHQRGESAQQAFDRMKKAVAGFTTYATAWPLSDADTRVYVLDQLKALYTDVHGASLAFRAHLEAARDGMQANPSGTV